MFRYEKLQQMLNAHHMTRSGLAKQLGISSRTIAKIGRGEKLSPIILGKISAFFGCRPEDLYEELPDAGAEAVSAAGSTLAEGVFHSKNSMYIIDRQYRLVNFNEQIAATYPGAQKGDFCYSALMNRADVCPSCPLKIDSNDDLTFFNPTQKKWISIRRTEIDYPGAGRCHAMVCRRSVDMRRNIRNRLPMMPGYDIYIEMNLTQNIYRIILPDDPAEEKAFSHDRLDDLILRTANALVHPDDREAFLEFWDLSTLAERISGPEHEIHGVFRECRKSGTWDTVYITIVPEEYYGTSDVMVMALYMIVPNHAASGITDGGMSDIYGDGQKVAVDYMTGLPLRRSYWSLLEKRLTEENGETQAYCVLATDIDRFHVINNWYGRASGDQLLSEMGTFLQDCDREQKSLSTYMGGDNFCTVFPRSEATLDYIVKGLTEIVGRVGNGAGFYPVFGACYLQPDRGNAQDAYDRCVMALKRGKNPDRGRVCWYDDRMIEEQAAEEDLLFRFRKGLEEGEITFCLMPICDIKSGRIVAAEALARWNSRELGPISPATFIPLLEKAGKISTLDYAIWEIVCRTLAKWRAARLPVIPISVNVSRMDVFSMDIVHTFTALVHKYGLRPEDIEIEFTESAYVENDTILREVQGGLRTAGFHTLIDDFGSGYSSLNFLKEIDSDAIKLDLRFLRMNDENYEKGSNIVSSVLSMAERINMVTIAEGVETEEQVEFLANSGCPLAQGYYFYKPMPIADFEALLCEPSRIARSRHLSDFRPHPKQDAGAEMKVFRGFDEELAGFMKTLQDVAAIVRIVDVGRKQEYRLDPDGHIVRFSGHCYDLFGRRRACSDCISATATETGKSVAKYETIGRDRYYIIAKPIRIAGEVLAIETAIRIL